ncbi:MAG: hypothetical protein ACE5NG_00870 [bacterium]
MEHLDKELHTRLQTRHREKEQAKTGPPLTEDILERYEQLIQAQCALRQIIEQGLPYSKWPFKRTAPQKKEISPPPPPFDWLEKQDPKTAKKALEMIDKAIAEMHQRYMWDIDKAQKEWLSRKKEAYKRRRPLVNKFRTALTERRRAFSGFIYLVVLPLVVGFLAILFLPGDRYQAGISKTLVPPPTSDHYWLNDLEMQLLDEWYKVSKSGRDSYVDAFVLVNRENLKQIGQKLIGQGNLWNERGDSSEAKSRFLWAGQIGMLLQRAVSDEELVVQLDNLYQPPAEHTTAK